MLERLRGVQAIVMRPLARLLLRVGVTPDAVTWFGALSVTVVALVCFPMGWLWQGAVAIAILSCSDMIDGHMAREIGPSSRWGSFLDASLDRIADAGVLGALAWYLGLHAGPRWAVVAIAALAAAQMTSYVKARAEAVGCSADMGIITRADRIALALLGALLAGLGVPLALEVTMAVLAVGGTVTIIQRIAGVRRQLRSEADATTRPTARART